MVQERTVEALSRVNEVLWGPWTFFVLLGAGLLFTVWTRFCQFNAMTHGLGVIRGAYDDPNDPGAINHFQALSAALSATIGLGNIGGVALAIGVGGPGALFWMWVVGFLGMALKTVEITLAMMYRNTDDVDEPHGGAMWVIHRTLGVRGGARRIVARLLAGFFCITLLIMTMTGGNMFQSWNVADLTNLYFGVPQVVTGIVLAVTVGLVIVGGIKRIGRVAARLVPIMCILYVVSGLAVLAVHASQIPAMLALIVHSAFGQTEASGAFLGGAAGLAFSVGLRRALFSNEAGLGSAPIAHAAAKTAQPAREGIVGGIGPFVDTICICTLTALVIIATGIWNRGPQGQMKGPVGLIELDGATHLVAPTEVAALPELPAWDRWQPGSQVFFLVTVPSEQEPGRRHRSRIMGRIVAADGAAGGRIEWDQPPPGARWVLRPDGTPQTGLFRDFKGATLTSHAFDRVFPGLGKWLVTTAAWLFAISTMISWSYYGEQGIVYMLGSKGVVPYKLVFLSLTIMAPAAVATDRQLGDLADFGTGWMLWANMLIVLMMGYRAVRCLADYLERLRAGQFAVRAGRRRTGPADGKNTP